MRTRTVVLTVHMAPPDIGGFVWRVFEQAAPGPTLAAGSADTREDADREARNAARGWLYALNEGSR